MLICLKHKGGRRQVNDIKGEGRLNLCDIPLIFLECLVNPFVPVLVCLHSHHVIFVL